MQIQTDQGPLYLNASNLTSYSDVMYYRVGSRIARIGCNPQIIPNDTNTPNNSSSNINPDIPPFEYEEATTASTNSLEVTRLTRSSRPPPRPVQI